MKYEYNGTVLEAVFGKIEELEFDAIALPTTPALLMDCGISLRVKGIAGQTAEAEAVKQAPGSSDDAVVTEAGHLPSKKIFHCVMLDDKKMLPLTVYE